MIIVLILIIGFFARPKRETYSAPLAHSAPEVRRAFAIAQKSRAPIFEFRKLVRDPAFSPYKFAQLSTLNRRGAMTDAAIANILAR